MKLKLELWLTNHKSSQSLVKTRFRTSKRKLLIKKIFKDIQKSLS